MTRKDYVIAAIKHQQTDKIPYVLGFEGGTDKELDAYYGSSDWRKKVQTWMWCTEGISVSPFKKIDDRFSTDIYGSIWRMDQLPRHLEKPALAEPDVNLIKWPSLDQFQLCYDEIMAHEKPDFFRYIHIMGGGLFESTWAIRGFENALADSILNEDFYGKLLDKLLELRLGMVEKCRDVKSDAIMFGDDWGDQRGVIIGPERWRKFLKPRWAKIFEAVHAQGKYAMCHCCGSVADIMPDIIEIGLDVFESVQPEPAGMDSFDLKKKYGDKITFWGCLGSQSDIQVGTPDSIRRHIDDLCRIMGKNGGYILAPAKSIQPGTPVVNSAAVVEAFAKQNV